MVIVVVFRMVSLKVGMCSHSMRLRLLFHSLLTACPALMRPARPPRPAFAPTQHPPSCSDYRAHDQDHRHDYDRPNPALTSLRLIREQRLALGIAFEALLVGPWRGEAAQ
jgi:hypothetical protein